MKHHQLRFRRGSLDLPRRLSPHQLTGAGAIIAGIVLLQLRGRTRV